MKTSHAVVAFLFMLLGALLASCESTPNSDEITSNRQETILMQAIEKIGMPAIKNFRELRMANRILEERDQTLMTWTYLWSDYHRCFTFIETSVAYPLPYATQRTSPQKISTGTGYYVPMPQADPNGLFSPANAEGTFIEMNNPTKVNQTGLVYSEPRISTFPYELPTRLVCSDLERPEQKSATLKGSPKTTTVLSAPKREPAD
jgi:hypothetical protein